MRLVFLQLLFLVPQFDAFAINPRHGAKSKKKIEVRKASPEVYSDSALNVHIVPHTHDDVGWLKTVDQYFYGANNSIQHAGVQYVISSVIAELEKDPSRTFTYVEMAFFARWFYEQSEDMQDTVRTLVANGQLSFANGGWCMHDEASAHYNAMIDQTTLGHQFLAREFGFSPRVGWQIDPFGHSSTQASLLSWAAGFDALYFGRIDYQDRDLRRSTQECEGVWRSSPSLGDDAQVFWSLTGEYGGNYGAPSGFDFDMFNSGAEPMMDDVNLHDYNIDQRIADFTSAALDQGSMTKGNHIMMTMGSDFNYESATEEYANLDKVIYYANQLSGDQINVFYSTPTDFADAKHSEGIDWTVKTDDFFPYADSEHAYWTGYFTSRPLLKRFERVTSGYLQAARQMEAVSHQGPLSGETSSLATLEAAQGVSQHHDAVSGTSKQHVALDYAQRLAAGVNDAADMMDAAFDQLTGLSADWEHCPLLNVSVCSVSAEAADGAILTIAVYNPLATVRNDEVVRVPLTIAPTSVTDVDGNALEFQVMDAAWSPDSSAQPLVAYISIDSISSLGTFVILIHFDGESASNVVTSAPVVPLPSSSFDVSNDLITLTFSNATGALQSMSFDSGDGNSASMDISQSFGYYIGFDSGLEGLDLGDCDPETWVGCPEDIPRSFNKHALQLLKERQLMSSVELHQGLHLREEKSHDSLDTQNSGAYIFRPAVPDMDPTVVGGDNGVPVTTWVAQGPIVTEVIQSFGSWLNQTIRVVKGSPYAEFSFSVGPVPIDDGLGKEVISKFSTSVKNGDAPAISTDSNGREFLERIYDYRATWNLSNAEPVAGNYYPSNAAAFIRDDDSQFSLIVDRSVGVASLAEGELEVMIHRRLLVDDSRGVGEPLDEYDSSDTGDYLNCKTGEGIVVVGTHMIGLSQPSAAMAGVRSAMDKAYAPLMTAFANIDAAVLSSKRKRALTSTVDSLPDNVKLLTLQAVDTNALFVRLEHSFGVDEDDVLSQSVSVNVTSLIMSLGFEPTGALELTLTGNQPLEDLNRLDWDTASDVLPRDDVVVHKAQAAQYAKALTSDGDGIVTLNPMEIRTAVIYV